MALLLKPIFGLTFFICNLGPPSLGHLYFNFILWYFGLKCSRNYTTIPIIYTLASNLVNLLLLSPLFGTNYNFVLKFCNFPGSINLSFPTLVSKILQWDTWYSYELLQYHVLYPLPGRGVTTWLRLEMGCSLPSMSFRWLVMAHYIPG